MLSRAFQRARRAAVSRLCYQHDEAHAWHARDGDGAALRAPPRVEAPPRHFSRKRLFTVSNVAFSTGLPKQLAWLPDALKEGELTRSS